MTVGTLAAGAALVLRDLLQDLVGKAVVVAVIVVGAVLSFAVAAPQIAVASVVAFTFAELADLIVYTRIRARASFGSRWWAVAVIASGIVGALVDTALFIGIAFGWPIDWPLALGQLIGKTLVSLLFVVVAKGVSRVVSDPADREPARA
ncbi:VUT family protein [Nocardia aurea]|uniref:VUT family protein n=1 Tax=Nocardia aurea TaxID=2144174 RepID=UPI0033B9B8B6